MFLLSKHVMLGQSRQFARHREIWHHPVLRTSCFQIELSYFVLRCPSKRRIELICDLHRLLSRKNAAAMMSRVLTDQIFHISAHSMFLGMATQLPPIFPKIGSEVAKTILPSHLDTFPPGSGHIRRALTQKLIDSLLSCCKCSLDSWMVNDCLEVVRRVQHALNPFMQSLRKSHRSGQLRRAGYGLAAVVALDLSCLTAKMEMGGKWVSMMVKVPFGKDRMVVLSRDYAGSLVKEARSKVVFINSGAYVSHPILQEYFRKYNFTVPALQFDGCGLSRSVLLSQKIVHNCFPDMTLEKVGDDVTNAMHLQSVGKSALSAPLVIPFRQRCVLSLQELSSFSDLYVSLSFEDRVFFLLGVLESRAFERGRMVQ